MSDERDPTLRTFEVGPYQHAIAAAAHNLQLGERRIGGRPLLPADAAEIAVGAAIRRLVADGQLPPLGTRTDPTPHRRLPNSHLRARPSADPPDVALDRARRALGG